jgi:hypothetical protein
MSPFLGGQKELQILIRMMMLEKFLLKQMMLTEIPIC